VARHQELSQACDEERDLFKRLLKRQEVGAIGRLKIFPDPLI
jgi:hypothetical protein